MINMISGQVLRTVTEKVLAKVGEQLPRLLAEYGGPVPGGDPASIQLAAAQAERQRIREQLKVVNGRVDALTAQIAALEQRVEKRDIWLWALGGAWIVSAAGIALLAIAQYLG